LQFSSKYSSKHFENYIYYINLKKKCIYSKWIC